MDQLVSGRADRPTMIEVYEPSQHPDMKEIVTDRFVVGANETVRYEFLTASAGYRMLEPTQTELQQYLDTLEQSNGLATDDWAIRARLEGKALDDPEVQAQIARQQQEREERSQREPNNPLTADEIAAGEARQAEFASLEEARQERLMENNRELREVRRGDGPASQAEVARMSGGTDQNGNPTPASGPGNPPAGTPLKPNPQTTPEEGEPEGSDEEEDAAGRKSGSKRRSGSKSRR